MTINLQNCIDRQSEIDAHRDFWKKPESEIILYLERWLQTSIRDVEELSAKENLTRLEYSILDYARKFVEVATARIDGGCPNE